MTSNYKEIEEYLQDIPKFAGKHDQKDTLAFYEKLHMPGSGSKVIHVAGTNGKGSVCAYMQAVLLAAGYSVGMFTSPHLVTTRERIRFQGEMISEEDFAGVFEQVYSALPKESYHPSYFEFLYFMGMCYFEQKRPDVILLETGLGGRLDATNSFPSPVLSIITRIGMDHMEYLGDTEASIAGEKAGIVKNCAPLVYLAKDKTIQDICEKAAKSAETSAFPVYPEDILECKASNKGIDFSYHSGYYGYSTYFLPTAALYQRENGALVVQALSVLQEKGILQVSPEQLKQGFAHAFWEGRMEEIQHHIYLDGAHNSDGIQAFLETVQEKDCQGQKRLLFAVVADKDYDAMIQQIVTAGVFQKICVTTLESARRTDSEMIAEKFKYLGFGEVESFSDVEEAYRFCVQEKQEKDLLYIAGSLYLVGQIKALQDKEH